MTGTIKTVLHCNSVFQPKHSVWVTQSWAKQSVFNIKKNPFVLPCTWIPSYVKKTLTKTKYFSLTEMTKPLLGSESHSFPGRRLKTPRLKSRGWHQNWLTNWIFSLASYFYTLLLFLISPLGMRLFTKLSPVYPTSAKTHTSGFVEGHQATMLEVRYVTDHLRAYPREPTPRDWHQSYRRKGEKMKVHCKGSLAPAVLAAGGLKKAPTHQPHASWSHTYTSDGVPPDPTDW